MYKSFCSIQDKLNSPVEEAYRVLRTNVQFCSIDGSIKTIAITSNNVGDGKTATAVNLASAMARSGQKTLLVDADLHKPMRKRDIQGDISKGLSHIMAGQARLDEIISDTNVKDLFFISCGPNISNAADLISSSKFIDFLDAVKKEFDVIIFDTPPLRSAIDGALISSKADGTLIVVKSKTQDDRSLLRLKEQLLKVNARILGVVLNKISKHEYKKYYDYSYRSYRKSSNSSNLSMEGNTPGSKVAAT